MTQCHTGATTAVTGNTNFCTDLPSGWNDEVCEVDLVAAATCGATPASGCTMAGNAKLSIKDSATNRKDKLTWKWKNGPALTQSSFGTPTASTAYDFCVYSNDTLQASAHIPAGPLWDAVKTTGYKYKDAGSSYGGIGAITLAAGDRSKISLKATGIALPTPASASTFFDTTAPVKVQLVSGSTCFESTFATDTFGKNTVDKFGAGF